MIKEDKNFSKSIFKNLDMESHIKKHKLDIILNLDQDSLKNLKNKKIKKPFENVTPNLAEAFEAEIDDLCRLHWLIISRKITTVLEFGVGKSTIIFNDSLKKNQFTHQDFVKNNLRKTNLFECHSIDNFEEWINQMKSNYNLDNVIYHKSDLLMGTFADRVCTYYDPLPNICPDFIYLDGPDQFSPKNNIRGISTCHSERVPMSADLLALEHFLLPGTLIVVDGRTANARFLKSNFQRNWIYCHDEIADQHFFELSEKPLGVYNQRQLNYCLGKNFFNRVIKS